MPSKNQLCSGKSLYTSHRFDKSWASQNHHITKKPSKNLQMSCKNRLLFSVELWKGSYASFPYTLLGHRTDKFYKIQRVVLITRKRKSFELHGSQPNVPYDIKCHVFLCSWRHLAGPHKESACIQLKTTRQIRGEWLDLSELTGSPQHFFFYNCSEHLRMHKRQHQVLFPSVKNSNLRLSRAQTASVSSNQSGHSPLTSLIQQGVSVRRTFTHRMFFLSFFHTILS